MMEKIYYPFATLLLSIADADMSYTGFNPCAVVGFTVNNPQSVTPMKFANWSTPEVLPSVNWESPESASITEHFTVTLTADP